MKSRSRSLKRALDKRLKATVTADSGFQSWQRELQGIAVTIVEKDRTVTILAVNTSPLPRHLADTAYCEHKAQL